MAAGTRSAVARNRSEVWDNAPLPHVSEHLAAPSTNMECMAEHWRIIHGEDADPLLMSVCVRCGNGRLPSCHFHPDAKAFAFGTGRFRYGYTSAWDTPHDRFFCCGGTSPQCPGCLVEDTHTCDPGWWLAYAGQSPSLDADLIDGAEDASDPEADAHEEGEGESDHGGIDRIEHVRSGMKAMDIG